MDVAFEVGDKAVYPKLGVTEIQSIETLEICGTTNRFYVLRCLDSDNTIRVPVRNARQVGLRSVVTEAEIEQVLEALRCNTLQVEEPNWNRRHRRYLEKMKSGELREVAEVLRDLHLTAVDKTLSYGERRVLEDARQLLIQELAVAQGCEEGDVAEQLDELLS
ncbi:MAG: CarD family transcriptional regulator [Bradymonadia bacterium]